MIQGGSLQGIPRLDDTLPRFLQGIVRLIDTLPSFLQGIVVYLIPCRDF